MNARDYEDALIFDKSDFPLLLKVAIYIDLQESNGNDLVFSEGKLISHHGGKQQEVDDDYIDFLIIKNWDTDDLIELLSLCIDCLCRQWKPILTWLKNGGKKVILKDVPPSEALYYKYVSNDASYFNCAQCGILSFVAPSEFDDIFDCAKANIDGLGEDEKEQIKVLCLSQYYNIDALWGYYANKFKGKCFGYKAKDIFESMMKKPTNCRVICFGDIDYGARPLPQKKQTKIASVEEEMLKCFEKEVSWYYQHESRFIGLFVKKTKNNYISIKTNISVQYRYDLAKKSITAENPKCIRYPKCDKPFKDKKDLSLMEACALPGKKKRMSEFRNSLAKMLRTMFPPSLIEIPGRDYKGEESIIINNFCENVLPEINFAIGSEGLRIPLAFGTTMDIARKIYPGLSQPFSLTFNGHCKTTPSFHFMDRQKNMDGSKGRINTYVSENVDYEKYFDYWKKNASQLKQIEKQPGEVQKYLRDLVSQGVLDKRKTQRLINTINLDPNKYLKKNINVVPETMIEISWTYQEILSFGTDKNFKKKLEEFFNEVFKYLGVK